MTTWRLRANLSWRLLARRREHYSLGRPVKVAETGSNLGQPAPNPQQPARDPDELHSTLAHVLAGGLGIYAPGCPRCEAEGRYVRLR